MPMGVAEFLEPTAPAVPATATNKEQHDDNDQKCRGIHVLFSIGYPYRNAHPLNVPEVVTLQRPKSQEV